VDEQKTTDGTALTVAVVGVAAALSPLAWSDSSWSWSDPQIIDFVFLAWQFLPFGVLLITRRHFRPAALVTTAALVAVATVTADVVVEHDTGSTSAIALLWVPIWLTVLIGLALLTTQAMRRLRAGHGWR